MPSPILNPTLLIWSLIDKDEHLVINVGEYCKYVPLKSPSQQDRQVLVFDINIEHLNW
jgi:hypothetical protein